MDMSSVLRLIFVVLALSAFSWAQDDAAEQSSEQVQEGLAQAAVTLEGLQSAFADAADDDIAELEQRVVTERASVDVLAVWLQAEFNDLNEAISVEEAAEVEQPEPDVDTAEELVGDPDPVVETSAALATLEEELSRARLLLRGFDALANELSERDQIITAQGLVDQLRAEIDAASRRLVDATTQQDLVRLREDLRVLRAAAEEDIEPIQVSRDRLITDLERLGPAPDPDAAAEAPEIAEERQAIQSLLIKEDAIVRQSAVNIADIDRLLADIAEKRRDLFYGEVLSRGASPLDPKVVAAATQDAFEGSFVLQNKLTRWVASRLSERSLARALVLLGLSGLAGFFLFFPIRRWVNKRLLSRLQTLEPSPGRRAWVALLRILTRTIPGILAGLLVLEVLGTQGVIDETTRGLAGRLWFGLLAIIIADGAATAILAPGVPGWRLLPLERRGGLFVKTLSVALVTVFVADRALSKGAEIIGGGQELALVQSAVVACLMALLTVILSSKSLWTLEVNRRDIFSDETKQVGAWLRSGARFVAVVCIAAALFGYVAFAYFVQTRMFMVGGLIIVALFVRLIGQEILRLADRSERKRKAANEDDPGEERLIFFWLGVVVDMMVAMAFLPLISIALGAEWVDVRNVIRDAFFGFEVGNITISIAQILAAIGTFALILLVTRFLQRAGEKRFFPRTKLDAGVQNSLRTIIGYIGLIIAIMSGVSVLGFNLSNLAIIAGALSVGIGFGLQSIVNNFVSGLILLFERPVKVGDWIVVNSGEGVVKRISVRATEIETWDRSSIIVPNSELISSSVMNWTLKDRWTRVTVSVGVSYDADPAAVVAILEQVVADNPKVMKNPEPFIYFGGFGDSSLDFEMRVFLRETAQRLPVQNELRIATFSALKKAGIEIPFPQRDIHIKTDQAAAKDMAHV